MSARRAGCCWCYAGPVQAEAGCNVEGRKVDEEAWDEEGGYAFVAVLVMG